jgi:hypothetical protein
MHKFLKFILGMKLYMFWTVPLSIIRKFSLYTQQWYVSYRFVDSLQAGSVPSWSCLQAVSKPVWHIPLLCVQWKSPEDGQRNCLKHAEFHSKNKFEKSVHLVGFIIRNLSWCPVTRTSKEMTVLNGSFEPFKMLWFHSKVQQCNYMYWKVLLNKRFKFWQQ